MPSKRKTVKQWPAPLWNQASVEVTVKIPVEAIARLKPEQVEALMAGMAKVLNAGPRKDQSHA